MHTVVAKIFAHGATCIGCDILQRCRFRGGCGHHDRVIEGTVVLQRLDDLGDRRALLADGDIDAIELARFVGAGVDLLLIEDGVDDQCRLAGLTVADDQFALAAPNRHERVDGLQPGLHRLVHRAPRDDPRRLDLDPRAGNVGKRTLAVDRLAESVDDAAQQAAADRDVDDGTGAFDDVALMDAAVFAEYDDANIVALEVERHAAHPIRKRDHLAGLDRVETIDASDAVADRQHLADFRDIRLAAEICDLMFEYRRNLRRANFHQNLFNAWPRNRSQNTGGYSSFPRKAGIQGPRASALDPRFRGGDE